MLAADPAQIETVLTGGDDYEIVCTIAPDKLTSFQSAATAAGVPVTEIGRIMAAKRRRDSSDRDGKPTAVQAALRSVIFDEHDPRE